MVVLWMLAACGTTCAPLTAGTWEVSGSCLGMTMEVELGFDPDTCGFTLADWAMDHEGAPTGGTVQGDRVTLTGGDWEGCEGERVGDTMSGTCESGCTWEMAAVAGGDSGME